MNDRTTPKCGAQSEKPRRPYTQLPFNEDAVRRAVAGDPDWLTPAERHEAGRRLFAAGLKPAEVATRLRCGASTAFRIRQKAVAA